MIGHDADLVGAYVLDALPPDELEAFELHVTTCDACRLEVTQLSAVVDVLPLVVQTSEPSESLRSSIFAAVRADAEAVSETTPRHILAAVPSDRPKIARFRPSMLQSIASIAAALVIVALGTQDFRLEQQISDKNSAAAIDQSVQAAIVSGATESHIPGTALEKSASAILVQPLHANLAYLLVQGLQPTPNQRVYQVWYMRVDKNKLVPRSAGIFSYNGKGVQIVALSPSARGYPLAAVTVEKCLLGCPAPRGPSVLLGKLSA
jgi:anti-sigma factor RsiW